MKVYFPHEYSSCRIIDGQHRLLAISKLSEEEQRKYFLTVIALQNYDKAKEIRTFIDINSGQQRIDDNLILLLKADSEWEPGTKEFKEKIAVRLSNWLNESFLKNSIYFDRADEIRGKKITLTTLVNSLLVNKIVDDENLSKAELTEVFSYLVNFVKNQMIKEDGYFRKNLGIKIIFRLINLYRRNLTSGKIKVGKEEFFQDICEIIDQDTINILNGYYGEAGIKSSTTYLIKKLKSEKGKKYPPNHSIDYIILF